jgi:transposase-like protein
MPRAKKFTDQQMFEIAMELISGKSSHAEACRKWGISTTYAYKLKDRALEAMRQGVGHPPSQPDAKTKDLEKKVKQLEELAGDQALAIRLLKKTME